MKISGNKNNSYMQPEPPGLNFSEIIRKALEEDMGSGDATSISLIDEDDISEAFIVSRGKYVMAGGAVSAAVFQALDHRITVKLLKKDGESVRNGDRLLYIEGSSRAILTGERTALNFLQRLTGIATLTRRYLDKAESHSVQLLDTRKTTPLMRSLEKYAVKCGGGSNHRMGLYDMIMIKDNHLALRERNERPGMSEAVKAAREKYPELSVEIEIDNADQMEDALNASPDWILLDNMSVDEVRKCVDICRGRAKLEVSGKMTLDNIGGYASTGADAISVGAITHSAPAADFSLEIVERDR